MAKRVWVLGSAVVDFVLTIDRFPAVGESRIANSFERFLGGKGVNQAVAAARSGANVSFVGALGLDDAASDFLVLLSDEGVDTSEVQTILEAGTGHASILVNGDAENMIAIYPGANMMMGASALSHLEIDEGDVVVASLEIPQECILTVFDLAKSRGAMTILNPAPACELEPLIFALTDVFTPNDTESAFYMETQKVDPGKFTAYIHTQGSQGVTLHHRHERIRIPAPRVEAVDPTGAGDCFNGVLAASLVGGMALEDSVRRAIRAASLSVMRAGAVPSMPSSAEYDG